LSSQGNKKSGGTCKTRWPKNKKTYERTFTEKTFENRRHICNRNESSKSEFEREKRERKSRLKKTKTNPKRASALLQNERHGLPRKRREGCETWQKQDAEGTIGRHHGEGRREFQRLDEKGLSQ